ncbi:MAG TPA: methionine--tRNA ligase, partial [Chthoniobacterales bacterium]|nr:methionine--tRNA ligase [Chthoniobacterales bacterium]
WLRERCRYRNLCNHMADRFYICTAIDYTNSAPHIGHGYEKILADVLARYHRLCGEEVFYLTGVDQHGQKVQQSAEKQGVAPEQFVADITEKFVALWDKLDVRYDGWAATTEPRHKQGVQQLLQRLFDAGQLYKATEGGYYSVRQEQFLTDKDRGPDGEFGSEWGEIEYREEENYYFRLAQHKDWLLALIDSRADLIAPDFRRIELRNAVEKIAGDLCISRPKSRLSWGIELPFDGNYVTYVWFDALLNYITFAPGPYDPRFSTLESQPSTFRAYWPAVIVIGKDILIPAHGIYWMIMLRAIGFSDGHMPRLLVHGWWNMAGAKMSKSLGNVIDPDVLAARYGNEAVRYYLMSDITTGRDADFSEERLIGRYNGDLANSLGNLLNRTLNMAQRYRDGVVRPAGSDSPLRGQANDAVALYAQQMDEAQVHAALGAVVDFGTACNTYIEMTAPWKLAKDPERADTLDHVLYALAESLRIIGILIAPVLPKASKEILAQLNWTGEAKLAGAVWGGIPTEHRLGKPSPVFPRIESETV